MKETGFPKYYVFRYYSHKEEMILRIDNKEAFGFWIKGADGNFGGQSALWNFEKVIQEQSKEISAAEVALIL